MKRVHFHGFVFVGLIAASLGGCAVQTAASDDEAQSTAADSKATDEQANAPAASAESQTGAGRERWTERNEVLPGSTVSTPVPVPWFVPPPLDNSAEENAAVKTTSPDDERTKLELRNSSH